MKVELKDSEDLGFIIDLFNDKGELVRTKNYWFCDLENHYRNYLIDMANDEEAEVTSICDWKSWLELEKERLKDLIQEGGRIKWEF